MNSYNSCLQHEVTATSLILATYGLQLSMLCTFQYTPLNIWLYGNNQIFYCVINFAHMDFISNWLTFILQLMDNHIWLVTMGHVYSDNHVNAAHLSHQFSELSGFELVTGQYDWMQNMFSVVSLLLCRDRWWKGHCAVELTGMRRKIQGTTLN